MVDVMAAAHPTVVSVNVCLKKGVLLRLLLLPLELGLLCAGLSWLVSRHCKMWGLPFSKAFAFGQIGRQDGGFDA
jgi:hypothetical protein